MSGNSHEREHSRLAERNAQLQIVDLLREITESAEDGEEPPTDPRTETMVGLSRRMAAAEIAMFAQADISSTELLDYWMVEYGGFSQGQWAELRGGSERTVYNNMKRATAEIHGPENV